MDRETTFWNKDKEKTLDKNKFHPKANEEQRLVCWKTCELFEDYYIGSEPSLSKQAFEREPGMIHRGYLWIIWKLLQRFKV
jgi:hypothetical protein